MALGDLTPLDILAETEAARRTAHKIFTVVRSIDLTKENLLIEYGKKWASMTSAEKAAVISKLANNETLGSVVLTWCLEYITEFFKVKARQDLLAELQNKQTVLEGQLALLRDRIAALS